MSRKDEKETALAKVDSGGAAADFAFMTVPKEESLTLIRENLGQTGGVTVGDLDRAKIPAGGGTVWTVPGLDGEEGVKELRGVIVFWKDARRLWKQAFSGGSERPDCFSDDSVVGAGSPGGQCAGCEFAKFGTDKGGQGRGQACKQIRQLFLIRQDEFMPLAISLPPSSLKQARAFFLRLSGKMIPYYGVVVGLTLEKVKNADGIDYSRVVFRVIGRLSETEMQAISSVRAALLPSLMNMQADTEAFKSAEAV